MPNPATTAFEARRGGDPKHPHRRGAAIQHLPRPSVVPAPGAPAHCRIARGERAVVEKGVPGSPDRRATPADTTEARKRSPATVSIAPERPPRPPPTYPRPEYAPQNAPLRPNNQKLPLHAISGLVLSAPVASTQNLRSGSASPSGVFTVSRRGRKSGPKTKRRRLRTAIRSIAMRAPSRIDAPLARHHGRAPLRERGVDAIVGQQVLLDCLMAGRPGWGETAGVSSWTISPGLVGLRPLGRCLA